MKGIAKISLGVIACAMGRLTHEAIAGDPPARLAAPYESATKVLREALNMKPDPKFAGDDEHIARSYYSGMETTRAAAAAELIKDADRKAAVAILAKFLTDSNTRINSESANQAQLIVELSLRDETATRDVITKNLAADGIAAEYRGTIEALWRIDPAWAKKEFEQAIADKRSLQVVAFIDAAYHSPERLPRELIDRMLKSGADNFGMLAASILAKRGDASVLKMLAENIATIRTDEIRILCDQQDVTHALGDLYDKGGREALLKQLDDRRRYRGSLATFAEMAAWEIMDRGTKDDIKMIEEFCEVPDRRSQAVDALIRISPERAKIFLKRDMGGDNEDVSLTAAGKLAKLGDENAIRFLEEACFKPSRMDDYACQLLLQVNSEKSRAAFLRVLKVAAEDGSDEKHERARQQVKAAFHLGQEIVPMLKEVLAYASEKQLESLWFSLSWTKFVPSKIAPLLDEALARKQYYPVIAVVRGADLENETEKKIAAKYLAACADSHLPMFVAEVGRSRKLLSDDAVLAIVREQSKDPDHVRECVPMLADLGTEEDLKLIAGLPGPRNSFSPFEHVHRALAVRRIISRIPK